MATAEESQVDRPLRWRKQVGPVALAAGGEHLSEREEGWVWMGRGGAMGREERGGGHWGGRVEDRSMRER